LLYKRRILSLVGGNQYTSKKREKLVAVRYSAAEHRRLLELVARAGAKSVGEYVRERSLNEGDAK